MEKDTKILEEKKNELDSKAEKVKSIKDDIILKEEELQEIRSEKKSIDLEIRELKNLLKDEKKIKKDYNEWQDVLNLKNKMDVEKDKMISLQDEKRKLREAVMEEKSSLMAKRANLEQRIKDTKEIVLKKPSIEESLEKLSAKMKKLKKYEAIKDELESSVRAKREDLDKLNVLIGRVDGEKEELGLKIDDLSKAKAACPLCAQGLHEDKKHEIINRYKKQLKDLDSSGKEQHNRAELLSKELKTLEAKHKEVTKKLSLKGKFEERLLALGSSFEEIKSKEVDLGKLEAEFRHVSDILEKGSFNEEMIHQAKKIDQDVLRLQFNDEEYKILIKKDNVFQTQGLNEKYERVKESRSLLSNKEEIKMRVVRDEGKFISALKDQKNKLASLKKGLEDREKIEKKYQDTKDKLTDLKAAESGISKEYIEIKVEFKRLEKQDESLKTKKKKFKDIASEVSVYEELGVAFGKNGIQAMIIESALPEIEEEANKLLNRLTDGVMKVKFQTQREKKSDGELKETLDILISDQEGEKNYEMFSGGEAFRINFAVRVALSKLLARRAGAKLKVLVIDEGFGTQDASGRSHLVEAINSVTDDFEMVLVITHIQDIKDLFPIKIEITKDRDGSHIEIVG